MPPKPWSVRELLKITAAYLQEKAIDSPRLAAEVLLAYQLGINRVTLYLNFDQPLTENEVSGYRSLIKRRVRREPLQYITGVQEFWSLDFKVDPRVLIPRPETELLIESAIEPLKNLPARENRLPKILDLGTGCGAIAISLAKQVEKAEIWAIDISAEALQVAQLNAEKHGVSERISFMQGDLWEPLTNQGVVFDIVLSNPPYIPSEDYNSLSPEIRNYEPRLALDGHEGGMRYIKRILSEAPAFIISGGWIMLEMGPAQTEKALELVEKTKEYGKKSRIKDYSHRYRVVMAQTV